MIVNAFCGLYPTMKDLENAVLNGECSLVFPKGQNEENFRYIQVIHNPTKLSFGWLERVIKSEV